MNRRLLVLSGAILFTGLAACSTPQERGELSQKTVEYTCGGGDGQHLTAQYTFQGQEALGAKVIFQDQAVELTRATSSNADMVGNTFSGNGHTWTTGKFTFEDVGDVDGHMLTRDTPQTINGQTSQTSAVLARDCEPVSVS